MKTLQKIIPFVLIVLLVAWGVRWYIHKTYPPAMNFNSAALVTVDDNTKTTINDHKGKVLIVSCFQTWCRDCAAETPVLNELATKFESENFKVIYITDEGNDKLPSFRRRLPSNKILFTYSAKSLASLGVHVYPTTFLLNKNGEVIKTKLEGYDWLREEGLIRELLGQ